MSELLIGVVEDEMVIADTICLNLKKLGYQTAAPAGDYFRAIKMISDEKPNLLLVDINLGKGPDGIELAAYVREHYSIPLIFLTANSDVQTLTRAKEVKPDAYLVKPFKKNDLFASIEIAMNNFKISEEKGSGVEAIMVKDGYDHIKVLLNEIRYISSDQNYAVFYLTNGKRLMVRSTLMEMNEKLPSRLFVRINRGTIVNVEYVTEVQTNDLYVGDVHFTISRTVREAVLQQLQKKVSVGSASF